MLDESSPAGRRAAYPHVESEINLGPVRLRNRITRTAHGTGYAVEGKVTERLIAYHEARGRGGVGSVFLETCGVHPTSPGPLWTFRDDVIDGLSKLADRVHAADTKVFAQLWHGGAQVPAPPGQTAWAASAIPDPLVGRAVQAMPKDLIAEVVAGFAAAARRVQQAGIDGVEIHGAHTYLLCSFLSPLSNLRQDEYGGSVENRSRFLIEALRAVRDACGPEFAVGVRMSGTEAVEGGLTTADTRAIAELLQDEGLVDWLNISMGGYHNLAKMIGAMHEAHGYELETSAVVTRGARVPTIVTGRITSLAEAERVLAAGEADIVSMVRALLADPDLVVKSLVGRERDVRPCIGCNEGCVGRRMAVGTATGQTGCTVNPEAGHEYRGPSFSPADSPRSVLVVGAGPAGLEAALTAAIRGHRVALYEAADEPGGLVRLHRLAPHREEIGKICDWQWDQIQAAGVQCHLGHRVDAGLVRELAPDVVIVATGSQPRRDGVQRVRPAHRIKELSPANACTPLEVLSGGVATPKRAVVFDDLGNYQAVGSAELLLERGAEVVYATSFPEFAPDLIRSFQRDATAERLGHHAGFSLRTRALIDAVSPSTVTLSNLDSGVSEEIEAELLVLTTGFDPDASLAAELSGLGIEVHLAGDAAVALLMPDAIASGREVGAAV